MKIKLVTLCFLAFGLSFTNAFADKYTIAGDSLIIQFGNNTRMVIHAKDKAGIINLKNYDLNKIVRDMGATLDTSNRETYVVIAGQNGKKYLRDTVLRVSRQNDDVTISVQEPKAAADSGKEPDTKVTIKDGGIYVKDGKEKVYVGSRGIHVEDGEDDVHIGNSNPFENNEAKEEKNRSITKSPRNGFNINLGLNAYAQNNMGTYMQESYDLKPWGSRFVSLGWSRGALISKGENAAFFIDLGLNFSWYNMMYQGNNTVKSGTSGVTFPEFRVDNQPRDLSKSKLTATFVNFEIMPTIAIKNGMFSHLSFGVYGGYRLDSYTKTKEAGNGHKERNHDNFYLNNFRNGVAFELGIRHFADLFVQYDMNELFQANKGPAVRMVSFGIKL